MRTERIPVRCCQHLAIQKIMTQLSQRRLPIVTRTKKQHRVQNVRAAKINFLLSQASPALQRDGDT